MERMDETQQYLDKITWKVNFFAGKLDEAPLYDNLPEPDLTLKNQKEDLLTIGVMLLGKKV